MKNNYVTLKTPIFKIVLTLLLLGFLKIGNSQTPDSLFVRSRIKRIDDLSLKAKQQNINELNFNKVHRIIENDNLNNLFQYNVDSVINDTINKYFLDTIFFENDSLVLNENEKFLVSDEIFGDILNDDLLIILLHDNYAQISRVLIENELENYDSDGFQLCTDNIMMINWISGAKKLQSLIFAIENYSWFKTEDEILAKERLIRYLSKKLNIIVSHQYPWYNYQTKQRRLIKGVLVNTSNDLFAFRNYDMQYTGAVRVGIITDFIKPSLDNKIISYQKIYFGTDVYTPYFRDTLVFRNDTSYNRYDRPHASFEYFGIGANYLTLSDRLRLNINMKIGKIGGEKASVFQTALHQDISLSPRPKGWAAQIAYPGRIGLSLEGKVEYLILFNNKEVSWKQNFFPSINAELSWGSYMTYIGAGIKISNKDFKSVNPDMFSLRTDEISFRNIFRFVYIDLSYNIKYIQHNTMLEGYGFLKTTENKSDDITPKSLYVIKRSNNQIRPITHKFEVTIAKQFRSLSFFYKYTIFSPEVKNMNGTIIPNEDIKLDDYWHQVGTIGLCFDIKY